MPSEAKCRTIGENPLVDAVVPRSFTAILENHEPKPPLKKHITFHLSVDLMDRARDAVYWTPGLTLAALAERGLGLALDELERQQGKPFSPRRAELKGGRPVR